MKLLCYHNALNLQKRKSLLHQHLDPKYFSLASPNNIVTEFLSDIFKVSQAARSNKFQAVCPHFCLGDYHAHSHSNQSQYQRKATHGSAQQFKRSRFDSNRSTSFSGGPRFKHVCNRFRQSYRGRQQFQHMPQN